MKPAVNDLKGLEPRAKSLRIVAYENFTQQILDENIYPGQFVSQRELMQLTGVPLGAVREMIPRLEAEGLIETVPNRGLQICHVDVKLVRNAFQMRLLIEREAALNFAVTVSDEDLTKIEDAHLRIVERASSGVIDTALLRDAQSVDWGLHDMMVDALGNEIISDVYRVNSLRIRLIRLENAVLTPEALLPAMQEHLDLIGAMKERDTVGVAEALARHMESARDRMLMPGR